MVFGTTVAIVQPGDRIDLIAARLYGDPTAYEELILNNPDLDIWDPEPGLNLEVNNA